MTVADIMGRKLHFVTPADTITRAAAIMAHASVGVLPVVESAESMKLVGVVTDRDIVIRHVAVGHTAACPVAQHMTEGEIVTVRQTDHVHDAMGRMRRNAVRRLPVLDDQRRVVGMVSLADVAVHVAPAEPQEFEKMMVALSAPIVAAV